MEFNVWHLLVISLLHSTSHALDNGLALTPPMGWLSWERFRCQRDCIQFPDTCVSEKLYMAMADRMVSDGYKDAGYEYVHIDDCWAASKRDDSGRLQADPVRFPSGIKALADYVHARGLKLGIYTDIGYATCMNLPGSEFYMQTDANTFAEWGIDLVKTDGCYADFHEMDVSYPTFGFFLNKTGRPMVYCCSWVAAQVVHQIKPNYQKVRQYCNVWRQYWDVQDSWQNVLNIIDFYGNNAGDFANFSGPGGFSDPDELIVGDFGLSYYQQKAQFGLWAMLASPLFMSVDLRTINPQAKSILLNKRVIAINQDPLGQQAVRLYEVPGSVSVWVKALYNKGSFAVAFLNKDDQGTPAYFKISLGDLGLTNLNGYNVTDEFEGTSIGIFKPTETFYVSVDPTSILLTKVVPL
ncbi:alpha-N-acetylgalactosaminidase-like [Pomacea canaliculata]|uniref:alpha-N-acetylgalactosaminidase-like n=1 Tax=Pomacea canaliculata TaxID=400727 RepID=UPI000D7388C4|nr:alpha-N-acetylgalactosaminidase-like [Pomacea canaliculata]XP_025088516.1 alpha-N-acetylgalactosaminidase-like [Pomacea canaliculata]